MFLSFWSCFRYAVRYMRWWALGTDSRRQTLKDERRSPEGIKERGFREWHVQRSCGRSATCLNRAVREPGKAYRAVGLQGCGGRPSLVSEVSENHDRKQRRADGIWCILQSYNSPTMSAYAILGHRRPPSRLRLGHLYSLRKKPRNLSATTHPFTCTPCPQPHADANLLSVSVDSLVPDISSTKKKKKKKKKLLLIYNSNWLFENIPSGASWFKIYIYLF